MFNPSQFCEFVVGPALLEVGLYSAEAEMLLLGTCCAESRLGTYVHQVGGPALGIYQMEPATHRDLWENYLYYRTWLQYAVRRIVPEASWNDAEGRPRDDLLISDMRYATILARLQYLRSPHPLPRQGNWMEAAEMWKKVYNTPKGAGTIFKFMDALIGCKVITSSNHQPSFLGT